MLEATALPSVPQPQLYIWLKRINTFTPFGLLGKIPSWKAKSSLNCTPVQCDQIGWFLKVLGNWISSKRSPNVLQLFGYFEKPHFFVKTALATFWATFGKNWATFFSNIWSRCSCHIGCLLFELSNGISILIAHFFHRIDFRMWQHCVNKCVWMLKY